MVQAGLMVQPSGIREEEYFHQPCVAMIQPGLAAMLIGRD